MSLKKIHLLPFKIIPMLLVFGIISACENDMKEVKTITKLSDSPVRTGKNIELLYSELGAVKIKIQAKKMKEYVGKKHYLEMTDGIKVLFFNDSNKISSTLTANYAIHQIDENIVEVKDNVVVVNDKGEQLNTEHLIWQQDSAKIYSNEFVKITTTDEIILGEGFEANQDFTKWKIHKIKGTILLKEEQDSLKTKQ